MLPLPPEMPRSPTPPTTNDMYEDSYVQVKLVFSKCPSIAWLVSQIPLNESLEDYVIMNRADTARLYLNKKVRIKSSESDALIARFNRRLRAFNRAVERVDNKRSAFYDLLNLVIENLPHIMRTVGKMTRSKCTHYGICSIDMQRFSDVLYYTLNVPRTSLRKEYIRSPDEEQYSEDIATLRSLATR